MTAETKQRITEDIYIAGTLLFGGRLALLAAGWCLTALGVG